ncbi:hypothetical protein OG696_36150 [Streptomyces sp. NBC_00656]|uniref:hypothetical protein n=1 Tax=Streptomyces sp. NBC_00656 TaxID=2903668 RepID=UPI003244846F
MTVPSIILPQLYPDAAPATGALRRGVVRPGDVVHLRGDGSLVLHGREATTINSGGEKIFAEEVERALLSSPTPPSRTY